MVGSNLGNGCHCLYVCTLRDLENVNLLTKLFNLGIAQEINARSEVFRIERQLEEARGRLTAIRQAKYKLKGGESDGETDGYQSGYESFTTRYVYYESSEVKIVSVIAPRYFDGFQKVGTGMVIFS